MTWFAFQGLNGGKAIDLAGTQEKQAVAEGFHGYGTEKQAEAQPNSINVLTRTLADTWIADYKAAVAEQAQPGGKNASIENPVTAAKAGATGVATEFASFTGLDAIGNIFNHLSNGKVDKEYLQRAAKIIVGSIMIIVGLVKLTGADRAATAAVKGAVL